MNKFIKHLYKQFDIKHFLIIVYHFFANNQTE